MAVEDWVGARIRGPDGRTVGRVREVVARCVDGRWRLVCVVLTRGRVVSVEQLDLSNPRRPALKPKGPPE